MNINKLCHIHSKWWFRLKKIWNSCLVGTTMIFVCNRRDEALALFASRSNDLSSTIGQVTSCLTQFSSFDLKPRVRRPRRRGYSREFQDTSNPVRINIYLNKHLKFICLDTSLVHIFSLSLAIFTRSWSSLIDHFTFRYSVSLFPLSLSLSNRRTILPYKIFLAYTSTHELSTLSDFVSQSSRAH